MEIRDEQMENKDSAARMFAILAFFLAILALFFAYRAYESNKTLTKQIQRVYYASPYSDPAYQQSGTVKKSYDPGPYEGNCDPSLDPVYQGNAKVGGGANIEEGYDPEIVDKTPIRRDDPIKTPDPATTTPSTNALESDSQSNQTK